MLNSVSYLFNARNRNGTDTLDFDRLCSGCQLFSSKSCVICDELGENYAFVQTGVLPAFESQPNAMMISKMGSGLSNTVDPCIKKLYGTETYKNLCKKPLKVGDESFCFDGGDGDDFYFDSPINTPTNELDTKSCSDGYCACPPVPEKPIGMLPEEPILVALPLPVPEKQTLLLSEVQV